MPWRVEVRAKWSADEWAANYRHKKEHVAELCRAIGEPNLDERWCAYVGMRDALEALEFYWTGYQVAQGYRIGQMTWGNQRMAEHSARLKVLEASTDRVDRAHIHGTRKIIRKWNETLLLADAQRQAAMFIQLGLDPQPVADTFRAWYTRCDRKAFDGEAWFDEEVLEYVRSHAAETA